MVAGAAAGKLELLQKDQKIQLGNSTSIFQIFHQLSISFWRLISFDQLVLLSHAMISKCSEQATIQQNFISI